MDKMVYCNDVMARMEELFFHELSDCAGWKTEFIGVDFIQAENIEGDNREDIIRNCIKAITAAGLAEEGSFAIAGKDILLRLKIKGCIHMGKEVRLKERGIKIYNCVIANMINDQLIEKLNYETAYIGSIDADEKEDLCELKIAIYETMEKIGCVSDWSEECRRIDENDEWQTIRA
jgi:DNA-binding protein